MKGGTDSNFQFYVLRWSQMTLKSSSCHAGQAVSRVFRRKLNEATAILQVAIHSHARRTERSGQMRSTTWTYQSRTQYTIVRPSSHFRSSVGTRSPAFEGSASHAHKLQLNIDRHSTDRLDSGRYCVYHET